MSKLDPRAQRSREALMEAAIVVLLDNPLAALSEIAIFAGVGRATLYRHFETRDQMLVALATQCLDETETRCAYIEEDGLTGRQALEAIFKEVIKLGNKYRFLLSLWQHVEQNSEIKKIYGEQLARLQQRVVEAKKAGEIKKSVPDKWAVILFDSFLYATWTALDYTELDQDKTIELAIDNYFNGIS